VRPTQFTGMQIRQKRGFLAYVPYRLYLKRLSLSSTYTLCGLVNVVRNGLLESQFPYQQQPIPIFIRYTSNEPSAPFLHKVSHPPSPQLAPPHHPLKSHRIKIVFLHPELLSTPLMHDHKSSPSNGGFEPPLKKTPRRLYLWLIVTTEASVWVI